MGRIVLAVCLICFGMGSLLKSLNWLPTDFCVSYQTWFKEYWPALFILLGIRILVKDRQAVLEKFITILMLLGVGLWVLCHFLGRQEWLGI